MGRPGLAGRGPDVAEPVHRHAGRHVALVPPYRPRRDSTFEWDEPKVVGSGWHGFRAVFGGGDGVIYAIQPDGELLWYYHDGRNQGTFNWQGAKQVGTGWHGFSQVFAGDGGVIYGDQPATAFCSGTATSAAGTAARLAGPVRGRHGLEQLHDGRRRAGRLLLRHPADGRLLWYRHYGHDQGYPIWAGRVQVGSGWQGFDSIWAVGNGYVYGRTAATSATCGSGAITAS